MPLHRLARSAACLSLPFVALAAALTSGCGEPPPVTPEADASVEPCSADLDCDDGTFCNGAERCMPGAATAAPTGCVPGTPPCADGETCDDADDACLDACATGGDADGDGARSIACGGTDCDDADAQRYPENLEICDPAGVDEDCDPSTFGDRDSDGDGFVDAACCNGAACGDDCDDAQVSVHVGSTEACNTVDDDCDGTTDETVLETFHPDADMDGYGALGSTPVVACTAPAMHVADATDCDDSRQMVNPATSELCDAIDNNCNGETDEAGSRTLYRDLDGDGHGDPTTTTEPPDCTIPAGWVPVGNDCDDAAGTIHPGAPELCDRIDQDCSLAGAAAGGPDPAEDADLDGHSPIGIACPAGGLPADDCDDASARAFPGGLEVCDGLDNDCDGSVDPSATVDPWCGPLAACDAGACVESRTLSVSPRQSACAIAGASLYCWGIDDHGQLGDGTIGGRAPGAVEVPGLTSPTSVYAGNGLTCALRGDGAAYCWGAAYYNAQSSTSDLPTATAVAGLPPIAGGAVRGINGCLRARSGTLHCWGENDAGQIGAGLPYTQVPRAVPGITDAVEVAVGSEIVCIRRRDDRRVWCWGEPGFGRLGRGTTIGDPTVPAPVAGVTDVQQVESAGVDTCALTASGAVYCWGDNFDFVADPTSAAEVPAARPVALGCTAVQIETAQRNACALCDDGRVRCWGRGAGLGDGNLTGAPRGPGDVAGLTDAVAIAVGFDTGCARRASGAVVCWGPSAGGLLGDGGGLHARPVAAFGGVTSFSAGADAACAVAGNAVSCWGHLDATTAPEPSRPQATAIGLDMASSVAVGGQHACAVRAAGELWCWGRNGSGRLGDGTTTDRLAPAQVGSIGTVLGVATGDAFTCAAEDDGDIMCFGSGTAGQLGGSLVTSSSTPRDSGADGTRVEAGGAFACAITADGVSCWGNNGSGRLGRGTVGGTSATPAPVLDVAAAPLDLAVGAQHACIVEGGTARCWGENGSGQLGDGTTTDRSQPTSVPGITGATAVAAGGAHSCAIVGGGEVRCWGAASRMGDGSDSTVNRLSPVAVLGVTGATAIAAGDDFTCAQVGTGLVCWGADDAGQLGRGILVPVRGLP